MSREDQVLRTIDKVDKIGVAGVVDLLQKPPEEFGADLDPIRAALFGEFIASKGSNNTETLNKLRHFTEKRMPMVMARLNLMVILEETYIEGDYTAWDRLIEMPVNDDQTWSYGRRPENIAWALDDIVKTIRAIFEQ